LVWFIFSHQIWYDDLNWWICLCASLRVVRGAGLRCAARCEQLTCFFQMVWHHQPDNKYCTSVNMLWFAPPTIGFLTSGHLWFVVSIFNYPFTVHPFLIFGSRTVVIGLLSGNVTPSLGDWGTNQITTCWWFKT